jgi:hypothetical protein
MVIPGTTIIFHTMNFKETGRPGKRTATGRRKKSGTSKVINRSRQNRDKNRYVKVRSNIGRGRRSRESCSNSASTVVSSHLSHGCRRENPGFNINSNHNRIGVLNPGVRGPMGGILNPGGRKVRGGHSNGHPRGNMEAETKDMGGGRREVIRLLYANRRKR